MNKPYNEDWMRARVIHANAERWYRRGLLSAERLAAIKVQFPNGFYQANVWVKIALFLFTLLLNGCAGTLSGAVVMPLFDESLPGIGLVSIGYGVGFFFLLNLSIRDRKLFRSGIDTALMYSAVGSVVGGLWLLVAEAASDRLWVYGLLALPVLAYAVRTYGSRSMTLLLFADGLFTLAVLALEVSWGRLLLPFLGMVVAGVVYVFAKKAQRDDANFYWLDALAVAEITALVVFYTCGNVFVVVWGNALISGEANLPFAGIFYALTAIVPVVYVVFGVRNRDRRLLVVGLLAVAASVLTFQNTTFHLPWALFLTLNGVLLIAASWWLLRRLDPEWAGFTSVPESRRRASTAEALSTTEFPQLPEPEVATPGTPFGGGSFGGAGAGEGY